MTTQLTNTLHQICEATQIPGAVGIVVTHDEIVAQSAVGRRRADAAAQVTIDDNFHIGSNSKAWTATVCATLVNEGRLTWETKPTDLWPDLSRQIRPEYAEITLEMLLRHTAGIPPYTADEELEDVPALYGSATEQRVAFAQWLLQEQAAVMQPGTEMSYSNAGYGIAAALAEAASGQAWETMLEIYLCTPLGIQLGIGWPALRDSEQPWGHRVENGTPVPHPPDDEYRLPPILASAGDLHIAMPHYAHFLQMNLAALQDKATLLPASDLQFLHNNRQAGYGLGWGVQQFGDLGLFSVHSGSAGTFFCLAAVAQEIDRAVALAVNGYSESDPSVEQHIVAGFKELIGAYCVEKPRTT